ncbi:MAG: type II toxin-antitoxin system RelE/ParE family toxin [Devosia sp.]|jgi:toxin ParE1/3/4|uniref:type II toxin-antitoxin system RelE/ParE family toxin n=1 Tax=unclassified Devosia TaxID=196773 RepID=UPI001A096F89|nr:MULTISPECIES: type II toxin-antitoxin system RelE/ParE family toxin [unclassified Devosia]MBF0679115.1 type II toxin-antitoxin system RelE/ParE family toxin [Devosia sp.]WEJ35334.1 type II toxin-antitoxin system RelE/ParE family toxin [Devosia sp. SD17-2]
MRLRFSRDAQKDLVEIVRYIARDNPLRATSFADELVLACQELGDHPERFPSLKRYAARGLRRRPYGNYSIIYAVGSDVVFIVRIISSARDLDALVD